MKKTMKFAILSLLVAAMASPVFAMDLQQGRSQGAVGEKADGYVVALKSTPDVQNLVSEVNNRRRAEYERISKENGQPLDVVAKLAAAQVIQGLPAGAKYQGADGSWKIR